MTTRILSVSQSCVLMLLVACFYTLPAHCETQLFVAASPTNVWGQTASRDIIWGQSFTALSEGYLDTISLHATKYGVFNLPPTVRLDFYRVSKGIVVTPPVASTTVSTSSLESGAPTWLSFSFPSNQFAVINSRQYAFSMDYDTNHNQFVSFSVTTNYTGGAQLRGYQGTLSADGGGFDLIFQVRATPPTVLNPGIAVVTNPVPNQLYATGTTSVKFGWDPIAGVSSYKLKLLFNGMTFATKSGITGSSVTVTDTYTPGYYTVLVRDANNPFALAWSDPVTFIVQRKMTPGRDSVFNAAPTAFKWTRSTTATRYRLKLATYNKTTGNYVVTQNAWIPQPAFGTPKWRPAVNSIQTGLNRWSITDYNGATRGYTSTAYFQVGSACDYMVIDLSGGTNASSYPVSYLSGVPSGGWTDAYKTKKLVMRKINPGTFTMGSPTNELGHSDDEIQHQVTLTRGFYIGVFEVTQRQWSLVMGNKPSYFSNSTYYAARPVEQVSHYDIRENPANTDDPVADWPVNSAVNPASFMGKLRAKTGLATVDLPTESQWEYACRAGTTNALNNGMNLIGLHQDANMDEVGRYWFNGGSGNTQNGNTSVASAKVGSYLPNAWGLYDMHGNVWEWCLDWYGDYRGAVSDPKGAVSGSFCVMRGGSWYNMAQTSRSAGRSGSVWPAGRNYGIGFRASMTLP